MAGKVYFMKNAATLLYLDSDSNQAVYTKELNGGRNQKWTWTPVGNEGYYALDNVATGFRLDAVGDGRVGTNPGGDNNKHQQWWREASRNGFIIKNVQVQQVLDSGAERTVYTKRQNDSMFQIWELTEA